jgi:hypothetical protein
LPGEQGFPAGDLVQLTDRHPEDRVSGNYSTCTAIVVNDGPLLPLTWKGQVLTFLSDFNTVTSGSKGKERTGTAAAR